jgi:hypothetical protein
MKTTKLFFMAALALTFAACSNDDNNFAQQPAEQAANNMITITAKLAPKSGGAQTRAVNDDGTNIVVDWAVNEQLEIISTNGHTATATINDVTGGVATISFSIDAAAVGQNCTIVYPASAATTTGVKDAATLLAAQDGTLNANLDVRVGAGTIEDATATLNVTTQPEAQFAIFKFTLSGQSIDATHPLVIKKGENDVVTTVTPASSATSVYVAMPPAASSTYRFIVTTDDNKYIKSGTAAITAGKYYQTTLDLTARYPLALSSATVDDLGSVIDTEGNIHLKTTATTASGKTVVAMIAYVGSDNGESSPYNHGLALALSDAGSGSYLKWKTSSDDAGHDKQTDSNNFTSESGLQYNDATHNSDTYPAFQAAKANNSTAAPTGCSAWFLASGYQWNKMITEAGGYAALRDGFSGITGASASNLRSGMYWSSTEKTSSYAWYLRFSNGTWSSGGKHTTTCYVRACLAF